MRKKSLIFPMLLARPPFQVLLLVLFVLALNLLFPVAFAQGTTSQSSGYGTTGSLFIQAWSLLLGTIFTGGIWQAIAQWVARQKNGTLQDALHLIQTLAHTKVQELWQSTINHLKAASEDGKLTPLEAKRALVTAIEEVWESLPSAIRTLLIGLAGDQNTAKGLYLRPIIEAAVNNLAGSNAVVQKGFNLKKPNEAVLTAARKRIGL